MSKRRLEFQFTAVAGVGYPRVNVSILHGEKTTGWLVSIVDTGALFTLAPIDMCEHLFGYGEKELKEKRESERDIEGIGGTRTRAYKMTCSALVMKSGENTLTLRKPSVYFANLKLPAPLLIGQRCLMERLWIVHKNSSRIERSLLVIGHYSEER